ncbi:MAG: HEPN domain-containing protein [Planctomycetes bacterium]|nr:HEPN domain-containing protein [Planctomycetota bacterium]
MAGQNRQSKKPVHDSVCFHCQQRVEKYLKALLEEIGQHVPKIHDLDGLLNDLVVHHPQLRSLRRGCLFLSDFAVNARYPGDDATKRQAVAAMRWATKVRAAARQLLNIRERRRKQ